MRKIRVLTKTVLVVSIFCVIMSFMLACSIPPNYQYQERPVTPVMIPDNVAKTIDNVAYTTDQVAQSTKDILATPVGAAIPEPYKSIALLLAGGLSSVSAFWFKNRNDTITISDELQRAIKKFQNMSEDGNAELDRVLSEVKPSVKSKLKI